MRVTPAPRSHRPPQRSASPSPVAGVLLRSGVRPSKSRGQNFLTSAAVAERIVEAAAPGRGDEMLEIGPGLGILSGRIAARPVGRLTLVEVDPRLAAGLQERFDGDRRVRVIADDFLALDLAAIAAHPPVKVIGNLPFNAAAAILKRLCDRSRMIERMVLMFQREVGERIRARPGDDGYSALSVFTALYFEIESHFRIAAGSFHPRPGVDAEVLVFRPRARLGFAAAEEGAVLETIRASFSAPRKTIRNALAQALGFGRGPIEDALRRAAIDPGVRAETLQVADFVRLARALPRDAAAASSS